MADRLEIVIPRAAVTEGECGDPERCMLALPANRQLNPLGYEVVASAFRIRVRPIDRPHARKVYANDERIAGLVSRFDTGDRDGVLAEMPERGYLLVLEDVPDSVYRNGIQYQGTATLIPNEEAA